MTHKDFGTFWGLAGVLCFLTLTWSCSDPPTDGTDDGDADVGEKVNIGAGSITANFDGKHKHRTRIGKGDFIGLNEIVPRTFAGIEDDGAIPAQEIDGARVADVLVEPFHGGVRRFGWQESPRQELLAHPLEHLLSLDFRQLPPHASEDIVESLVVERRTVLRHTRVGVASAGHGLIAVGLFRDASRRRSRGRGGLAPPPG